jgi:hypothetical protein
MLFRTIQRIPPSLKKGRTQYTLWRTSPEAATCAGVSGHAQGRSEHPCSASARASLACRSSKLLGFQLERASHVQRSSVRPSRRTTRRRASWAQTSNASSGQSTSTHTPAGRSASNPCTLAQPPGATTDSGRRDAQSGGPTPHDAATSAREPVWKLSAARLRPSADPKDRGRQRKVVS